MYVYIHVYAEKNTTNATERPFFFWHFQPSVLMLWLIFTLFVKTFHFSDNSFLFPAENCCADLMSMAREARRHRLGPLHPAFNLLHMVQTSLQESLPEDAHVRASGRLCVSLTRMPDGKNVLVSDFGSRDELIQVSVADRSVWAAVSRNVDLYCSVRSRLRFYCAVVLFLSTAAWSHPPTEDWWVWRSTRLQGLISDSNIHPVHQTLLSTTWTVPSATTCPGVTWRTPWPFRPTLVRVTSVLLQEPWTCTRCASTTSASTSAQRTFTEWPAPSFHLRPRWDPVDCAFNYSDFIWLK